MTLILYKLSTKYSICGLVYKACTWAFAHFSIQKLYEKRTPKHTFTFIIVSKDSEYGHLYYISNIFINLSCVLTSCSRITFVNDKLICAKTHFLYLLVLLKCLKKSSQNKKWYTNMWVSSKFFV